jgi:hypothetical protein
MKTNLNISFSAMKTVKAIALVAIAGLLASCSQRISTKQYYDDDIYFSSKDLRNYTPPVLYQPADTDSYAPSNRNSNSAAATPDYQNGQQVIDDYYDYQYASRIRRFYYPSYGMGYYDPYFTNTYWYNYNPYSFGTSVYVTYNFWPNSYNYWGYGNPWGYNPWMNNPYFGYNGFGWGGYGYGSPWMPYNPYTCGWGYGNPYWGYGGWGWNNGYFNGYNNGYNNGYWNGFNDGMAYNNYYFNGFDNNSYNYYGPYKQTSSSGKFNSFGEQVQTAMTNDGEVLKFTPAIGSGKPTLATNTKPMNFDPATPGTKGNAITNAPGVKGAVSDVNAPTNLGEKNVPVNTTKPNNSNFDSYKPIESKPVESKPSITGKPIQVFDYNETAPAGNKGNLNTVNPNQGKQQANPNFDNKPTQQPVYQNNDRPQQVQPNYNERPQPVQPNSNDRPQPLQPNYNERPRDVEPARPNTDRPQQTQPDYNRPQPVQPNNNDRPRDSYSQPQQQRPQQNQARPERNDSRPQTSPRSDRNERPQYSAPQNNNRDRGNYNSAPSNNSGGGNRGNAGSSNNGGGKNTGRPR